MKIENAITQIRDSRDLAGVLAAVNSLLTGPVFRYVHTGKDNQLEDLAPIDRTLSIPEFRVKGFLRTVERVNRQAARNGLDPLTAEFLGVERKTVKVGRGSASAIELTSQAAYSASDNKTYVFNAHKYHVTGKPPVLNAWRFRAAINHSEHSQPIIKAIVPEIPKEYRTATTYCEHCQTNRDRNDVYVLQNALSGKWMQVGRTCLRQFTQVADAEKAILAYVNALELLAAYDGGEYDPDSEGMGGGIQEAVDLDAFMRVVVYLVDKYGYVSRSMAEDRRLMTTGDGALSILRGKSDYDRKAAQEAMGSPDIARKAKAAVEWAKALPEDGSDYENNLRIIAMDGYFNAIRESGYAASIYPAYLRATESERKASEQVNDWLPGKVGDKHKGYRLRTVSIKAIEGHYGMTYLHTFHDDEGRTLKWFGSKRIDRPEGFPASFTVKGHDTFREARQTVITRVKEDDAKQREQRLAVLDAIVAHMQEHGTFSNGRDEGDAVAIPKAELVTLGVSSRGLAVQANRAQTLLNLRDQSPDNPDPYYLVSMAVNRPLAELLMQLDAIPGQ